MNQKFIQEMEQLLSTEKSRLEAELVEISTKKSHGEENFQTDFPNLGDKDDENAEEVATYSTNLTLEHTLESSLRDVEAALQRIKNGTYGICKYCSGEISEKRLQARPASSSCIECKKNFKQEV